MKKSKAKAKNEANPDEAKEEAKAILANLPYDMRLDDVDRAIIMLKTKYPGATQKQLAEAIGYSEQGLCKRVNRTAFKQAIAEMGKGVMELLIDAQVSAVRKLKKTIDGSDDPEVFLSATRQVMTTLARAEQASGIQQNLVFSVRVGEGGQIYREARPMTEADNIEAARRTAEKIIASSRKE